ncbi:phosphate--nucleotide phosphotransferase [Nonlabens spongiae]|uniref:Phosphate--nucleotide phosphotransferase n=1 Tax=Nonlabens spongiae TaxID=331648 RepID=A0A1W6MK06_9FLAO|nr:PPK2 family polyphosphate kinase [Nonlabens spongiae]ARN77913.1 phosphate--nucleotide phosphotransferase [Nonlabens spongiae]
MDTKKYLASANVDLSQIPTRDSITLSKSEAKAELDQVRRDLAKFQEKLFANDTYSVLACFQGMDTAGKDSLVREVFKDFNVRGVEQHSFKVPTELERSHGYLWRHYVKLPQKGTFGIFNRTHYENVLVTRVHPEYLMAEKLPGINNVDDVDQNFWDMRFDQINNFETELVQNGTIVFKFFLHLSKGEQKNRLLRRLRKPEKNWKFSPGDLAERKLWDKYQYCYQEAIKHTHNSEAPWYIIPADDKPMARLIVARILLEELNKYKDIDFPELSELEQNNLQLYKDQLNSE